eukprot:TRINITY_DN98580_c0_g1_i1.p3 TRINITY_DN98580_c0_g1~~TRINITY_DN98580_c0_g1_i1.p3  ORF type:complete len:127 (-),score=5.34 TRINITY_DN98580_c0_g1_i1:12-368(-)
MFLFFANIGLDWCPIAIEGRVSLSSRKPPPPFQGGSKARPLMRNYFCAFFKELFRFKTIQKIWRWSFPNNVNFFRRKKLFLVFLQGQPNTQYEYFQYEYNTCIIHIINFVKVQIRKNE